MNALNLIQQLARQDIILQMTENGSLTAKAPKGAITAEISDLIKQNKREFIDCLTRLASLRSQVESNSVIPVDRNTDKLPLSFAQQRLWFIDSLQGSTPEYNMPMVFELSGTISLTSIQQAFREIIARHEILRTVYEEHDGEAYQKIKTISEVEFAIQQKDISELDEQDKEAALKAYVREEVGRPFNLSTEVMLRVSFIKTAETSGVLLFNMHHIASDGWSMEILMKEFFALYHAQEAGEANPLPELAVQYADYAHWQRHFLAQEQLEGQLDYWEQQLEGLPALHSLPLDKARPAQKQYQGERVTGVLPKELAQALLKMAQQFKITPFMLLHGALSLLLSRHGNSKDVVIGTPIANREQRELAPLIGFFVNTLVLRADTGHKTVGEYLAHIRQVNLDAQANQSAPFEQIVERLKVSRSGSHSPLFQIMMTTNSDYGLSSDADKAGFKLPGVTVKAYSGDSVQAKFDLDIDIQINDQGVTVHWNYDVSLFDKEHIAQLNAHFERLLTGLSEASAQTAVSSLPLLSEEEEHKLLYTLNDTAVEYDKSACIHTLFERQVDLIPEQVAVAFGDEVLQYKTLDEKANQLAHYLRAEHGIGPESLVGVCADRSLEMVIAVLGILKAGGAYVPLDPSYPRSRLEYMIEDASLDVVLSYGETGEALSNFMGEEVALDGFALGQGHPCDAYPRVRPRQVGVGSSNLAYVIYTSGSTGQPKGVMIEHQSLHNNMITSLKYTQLSLCATIYHCSSVAFDAAVWVMWQSLVSGAKLRLATTLEYEKELVRHNDVSHLFMTPSMLRCLKVQKYESLTTVMVGGEHCPDSLAKEWGSVGVEFLNAYGPTEITICSSIGRCLRGNQVTIGAPFANMQYYVLGQDKSLLPYGSVGELYVGGDGVARGYLNKATLTQNSFIPNPYFCPSKDNTSKRLYKTGDLVKFNSDGELVYINRADDQVKIRGFRVELGEIESHINLCTEVESSVVLITERGATQNLAGYIKLREGITQSSRDAEQQIQQYLKISLPAHMIPSKLIVVSEFPRTANGKVDKVALSASTLDTDTVATVIEAKDTTEKALVQIWSELFSVSPALISTEDDFFELGGHSLLSMRLCSEIEEKLNVQIPLREIYDNPTIVDIAILVKNAVDVGSNLVSRVDRNTDKLPLSFAQQRLWFIDSLQGSTPEYNMPMVFELSGTISLTSIQQAFREIIARHEILRTVYEEHDGEAYQKIKTISEVEFAIQQKDISELDEQDKEAALKAYVREEVGRPFNLSTEVMLRVSFIKTAETSGVLLFNMHHIASDGWSMEILMKEFFALYHAQEAGEANPLPELAVQYADYAHWQRHFLAQEQLEGQLDYWEQQLEGLPALHSLPLDKARPAQKQYQGERVTGVLPKELAQALLKMAQQFKITPFMLLHGALSLLLSRHGNSKDVVIGTPIANREQRELAPLIGFFVNTLVLRADTGHKTVGEYLAHIRQVNLDAQANQSAPFEQIVERLKVSRSGSHSPLFQIMMTTNSDYGLSSDADKAGFKLPGVTVKAYSGDSVQAKFDLDIDIQINDQGVTVHWNYDVSLFDKEHIAQLNAHFERLLTGLSEASAQTAVSSLPLLSEEEEHKLLYTLNDTAVEYDKSACIHTLFERQVDLIPEQVAVAFGDEVLQYKTLDEKANQLAHYLRAEHGIGPESLVGVCADRSLEMVIAVLGILKAGGAYVPLDPSYPRSRLEYMIADASLSVIVSHGETAEALASFTKTQVKLDGFALGEPHPCDAYSRTRPQEVGVSASHLAYVIYTSGSTGQPKGVMIEHKAIVNYQNHITHSYNISYTDCVLQFSNTSFDIFIEEFFGALCHGARLELRNEDCMLGLAQFTQFCDEKGVTIASLPTAFWAQQLTEEVVIEETTLRMVIVGGEELTHSTVKRHYMQMPQSTILVNTYGPTEATITATTYVTSAADLVNEVIPIGKPNKNNQLYILNAQLELCSEHHIGELYIGGDGLARGYLNKPELTQKVFINNPYYDLHKQTGSRVIYRTGDLVKYSESGCIEFLGRKDSQVKIRGYRLELAEVESHLIGLKEVESALVLTENQPHGPQLIAFIKLADATISVDGIREKLKAVMPNYMLPQYLEVVTEWPLNANGKIDKAELLAGYHTPSVSDLQLPSSKAEQDLINVLAKVLDKAPNQLDMTANFFHLGGHSLLVPMLTREINNKFDSNLKLKDIFENPTAKELVDVLASENIKGHDDGNVHLITLSEGSKEAPALVLIHPVGGSVACYAPLLSKLNVKGSVYGISTSEIDEASLSLVAEKYNKLLNNHGVNFFSLAGWSIGGMIALEMASQLEQNVSVVLIDSYTPETIKSHTDFELSSQHRALHSLVLELNVDLGILPTNVFETDVEVLCEMVVARGIEQNIFSSAVSATDLHERIKVISALESLTMAYQLSNYRGHTLWVKALSSDVDQVSEEAKWLEHCESLQVVPVVADHFSILRDPSVDSLSQAIESFLLESKEGS
ncbi:non-ribosomal peptide synthetase [Pseudoalteromonas piscicida]|uniref:non-ribosomal peptide synthetase n=2 Tax=Pseudoalteromonas piscicida TaxID=43662 RepID=UPI0016519A2F|nr:non-ribosomal peptide synthetase [Pseudoalteromonas piscicida]